MKAMLDELRQESVATKRVLERVPVDRLSWRPHPKSMSIGQLAIHVAGIPGAITRMAQLERFDTRNANPEPDQPDDRETILSRLQDGLQAAEAYLGGLDEASAAQLWRLTAHDKEVLTIPRAAVVRTFMLNHLYHHRGQLSVYLRLLGLPVPVIYGRSADERPFG